MSERKPMQNTSDLEGKVTEFKNATFHGANFANIKNTTGAQLPSASELKPLTSEKEKKGLFSGIFSKKDS